MRISKIRKLIKLVEKSDIEGLEISGWGKSIRITKRVNQLPAVLDVLTETRVPVKEEVNLVPIKSPMVGTFYRGAPPEAKPYVEIGQEIKAGQVLCVIEAVGIMNEIESEIEGQVVKICVENGKPIEFGQVLFLVKPSK